MFIELYRFFSWHSWFYTYSVNENTSQVSANGTESALQGLSFPFSLDLTLKLGSGHTDLIQKKPCDHSDLILVGILQFLQPQWVACPGVQSLVYREVSCEIKLQIPCFLLIKNLLGSQNANSPLVQIKQGGVFPQQRLMFTEFIVSLLKYTNRCRKVWRNLKYKCIFLYIFT